MGQGSIRKLVGIRNIKIYIHDELHYRIKRHDKINNGISNRM